MSRTVDPFVTNGAIRSAASHALLNGHSSPALHARPCVPPAERAASNLSLAMLLKRAQTASVSDCDAFDAVRSRMAPVRVRATKWPYRESPRNNINVCFLFRIRVFTDLSDLTRVLYQTQKLNISNLNLPAKK